MVGTCVGGVVGTGVFPGVGVDPLPVVGEMVGVEVWPGDGIPPAGKVGVAPFFVGELFVLVGAMWIPGDCGPWGVPRCMTARANKPLNISRTMTSMPSENA